MGGLETDKVLRQAWHGAKEGLTPAQLMVLTPPSHLGMSILSLEFFPSVLPDPSLGLSSCAHHLAQLSVQLPGHSSGLHLSVSLHSVSSVYICTLLSMAPAPLPDLFSMGQWPLRTLVE